MSSASIDPPVRLLQVPLDWWSQPSGPHGRALDAIVQEVAQSARKIAKGLPLTNVRSHLLALSQRVADWAFEFGHSLAYWEVPRQERAAWYELLAVLARQHALRAAGHYRKHTLPPFLPVAFPPGEPPGAADPYGVITVPAHSKALQQTPVVPGLQPVLAARLEQFRKAQQERLGIVEYVGFFLPGYNGAG